MMKGHNMAILNDLKGRNNIEVEINKNKETEDFVRFKIRDDEGQITESLIPIKDLYGLIFLLVGEKEQDELMPIRQTEVRTYMGQHRIELKKNMKKGEIVVANYRINVPLVVENKLRGIVGKKKSSGILIPK